MSNRLKLDLDRDQLQNEFEKTLERMMEHASLSMRRGVVESLEHLYEAAQLDGYAYGLALTLGERAIRLHSNERASLAHARDALLGKISEDYHGRPVV